VPNPVVTAIQRRFPPSAWVTMVAIGLAESGLDPRARGDLLYLPGSCRGYCSWGALQINLCAHAALIATLSGRTDPCGQAAWLEDPDHTAQAAYAIWRTSGYGAWSTWWQDASARIGPGQGPYRAYLPQARALLGEAPIPPAASPATLLLFLAPFAVLVGFDIARTL
jgi:hypothetical protein